MRGGRIGRFAHVEVWPKTSKLSVNTIAGAAGPPTGQLGLIKLKLFVSAVRPVDEASGTLAVPLLTAIWTTIVEPVLKTA
jgi:hypothetical protein